MPHRKHLLSIQDLDWTEIFELCIDIPHLLPKHLESLGISLQVLQRWAAPSPVNGEPYSRKILFKATHIEVMLATWSNKAISSPHNHGSSQGLIWFAQGSFSEQSYSFKNQNLDPIGKAVHFSENTVVKVNSGDIHSCGPEADGLSLHLYAPPIHKMRVWDISQKRTLTVANESGAWIPSDSQLILSSANW
jgi:predicted metal-dependent enzyme (double-stranded beta helix superfamily)